MGERSQLEVVPRNSTGGGRPMSTVSAGGSLGRGSRALHLQHHQSSLSALHMTANHSGTVDRRRSSLRGSLSRAFGLRPRSEKASPSSSSDTGSLASQYMSSARSNSPPPPQLPPRPITGNKRHRRVKSIGDIDYITSAAYGSYSGYSNVLHGDQYQYQQTGNYYQLKGGYYSPQSTGPPFPGVQRYGSLAEEAWSCTTKDDSGNPKPSPRTYLA
ncbi:Kazrin [Apis cerana cerana]|uniref:Kazrin n=1 Tax=Apis cerana cerana TaxID=94128 RepID=A0A2A3EP20_APICC|nr:Kazrin [Apis cerana cerana]